VNVTDATVDLLRRTLELLTTHPELHVQDTWLEPTRRVDAPTCLEPANVARCGTVGCLAGYAVVLSESYPVRLNARGDHYGDVELLVDGTWLPGGSWVAEMATELLGLTEYEADALFAGGNSLATLWLLAEELTDGRVAPPPDLPITNNDHAYVADALDGLAEVSAS
jgi:hypothetical protein